MSKELDLTRFMREVEKHELTVNLDNGLFRDLTVKDPDTLAMHFNITTRPGFLMYSGDMGCFVFERLDDMFQFFRSENDQYSINPYYWSEKLQAVDGRRDAGYQEYSSEQAKAELQEWLGEHIGSLDHDEDDYSEKMNEAAEAVKSVDYSDEYAFVAAVRDWHPDSAGGMDLTDFDYPSVMKYTTRYLWACYAIVHAIKLYDQAKAGEV